MATLNCNKDGYSREDNSGYNYGTCNEVLSKNSIFGESRKAYFNFDTTGISLTDNLFRFYYVFSGYGFSVGTPFSLKRVTSTWNEGSNCGSTESSVLTWDNIPSDTATNEVTFYPNRINDSWQYVDVTTLIRDSGSNYFSFVIYPNTSNNETRFYSREWTYVPYIDYRSVKNFVRTAANGGDDANDGASWTNPWATIDKAAKTVLDGAEVQIEGGTYNAEPAANDIAPVNAGTTGIKYTVWGTAGSGTADGTGTGTVTVEKNA